MLFWHGCQLCPMPHTDNPDRILSHSIEESILLDENLADRPVWCFRDDVSDAGETAELEQPLSHFFAEVPGGDRAMGSDVIARSGELGAGLRSELNSHEER